MVQRLQNKEIIFAPHLDDEIIGCYSILNRIDLIVYFHQDYRVDAIKDNPKYWENRKFFEMFEIGNSCTIYVPSKYDWHPLHKEVNRYSKKFRCKKMYYSVEMNVPWLNETVDWKKKKEEFDKLYPNEDMKNDKYFLFESIKNWDDITYEIIEHEMHNYHIMKLFIPTYIRDDQGQITPRLFSTVNSIEGLETDTKSSDRIFELYQNKYGTQIYAEIYDTNGNHIKTIK